MTAVAPKPEQKSAPAGHRGKGRSNTDDTVLSTTIPQKQGVRQWLTGVRTQASLAGHLHERGAMSLSEPAQRGVAAISGHKLSWETIHALYAAWNAREELTQLAPDGLFDREDRREYARWYAARQFEMFGLLLLALGVLREGGTS